MGWFLTGRLRGGVVPLLAGWEVGWFSQWFAERWVVPSQVGWEVGVLPSSVD